MAENNGPERNPDTPRVDTQASHFFATIVGTVVSGIFSSEIGATWHDHFRRLWIGASGGAFYTILKNYFGDTIGVYGLVMMNPSPYKTEKIFGYIVAYLVAMTAGGVTAWLSAQRSGRLLFIIGMFGVPSGLVVCC